MNNQCDEKHPERRGVFCDKGRNHTSMHKSFLMEPGGRRIREVVRWRSS